MNILITSAGRRGYMVEYFRNALDTCGISGNVIVSNSVGETSACLAANRYYVTPNIIEKNYLATILNICEKEDISIVLSLFDIDVDFLSEHKSVFDKAGIKLIAPEHSVVRICNDKILTEAFCQENGFFHPKNYLSPTKFLNSLKNNKFTNAVVKPRFGTGSIATDIVKSRKELELSYELMQERLDRSYLNYFKKEYEKGVDDIVIQNLINGKEYGLDVVNDLKGNVRAVFIKEKWTMRTGETEAAKIIYDEKLEQLGYNVGKATKHIGNLDIDVMKGEDGINYIIDINPRFGGHYPFAHQAGANVPAAIINWCRGLGADNSWLKVSSNKSFLKELVLKEI